MKRGDTGKTQGSATMARKPRGNQHASLRDKLERAAQGLYHGSESNYPYHFFCLPWDAEKDFTLENFLIRLGVSQAFLDDHQLSINDIASERPFEEFILGYQDPATADEPEVVSELKQRKKLIKVLKENLKGIKVIRVGVVQISCYVAGIDADGDIAGLLTTAIET